PSLSRQSRSSNTAAATIGPARQPRPASSAPATRSAPRSRSCRKSGPCLEATDPVRWPVGRKRLADQPLFGQRTPEATAVAVTAGGAHHAEGCVRHGDRRGHGAAGPGGTTGSDRAAVRFDDFAVSYGQALLDRDRVARPGHDPLDEGLARLL